MTVLPSSEFQVGQRVDRRYLLKRAIARTSMATLFEAEQIHTGRRLVVKGLVEEFSRDPVARTRLLREGKALERCRSRWVVDVIDSCVDEHEQPFLALELLEGRSLDTLLTSRTRLPLPVAVKVVSELCAALQVVHRAGLVHRDVKPGNLFIVRGAPSSHDQLKLLDFGIAGLPEEDVANKLTRIGERIGTREYMPIEQLLAGPTDARSDLYSAMAVFVECVTGKVPFVNGHQDQPPPLSALRPGLPAALDRVVARGLARDADARYRSATELAEAVLEASGVEPATEVLRPFLPPSTPQARGFARAHYITPCRAVDGEQKIFDGRLADVSEGGVLALFPVAPALGRSVQLRFCLPVSGRAISVSALPRWERGSRVQMAVGLEFEHLPAEARDEIRRFVLMTSDPLPPATEVARAVTEQGSRVDRLAGNPGRVRSRDSPLSIGREGSLGRCPIAV